MTLTTIDPRSALVVIDLQKGIAAAPTQPHAGSDVVARTVQLADAFRAKGLPVILVRVSFAADGADMLKTRTEQSGPGSAAAMPADWDQVVDDLITGQEIIVTKRNWGAFHGTDLDVHLRRRGITQIVLTGIATSIGVESTARAASEHGYHLTLATDAMADMSEDNHRHSIEQIFPRLGETGTTAEILALLENSGAAA